jgi:hypothetical protein
MPKMALTDLLGGVVPERVGFTESVMVRTWSDHLVDPASFSQIGLTATCLVS